MALKFEDCVSCKYRRKPRICANCDCGEYFVDIESVSELSFEDEDLIARADKSLVTADDEPDHNPDDLIRRVERNADETEESEDE